MHHLISIIIIIQHIVSHYLIENSRARELQFISLNPTLIENISNNRNIGELECHFSLSSVSRDFLMTSSSFQGLYILSSSCFLSLYILKRHKITPNTFKKCNEIENNPNIGVAMGLLNVTNNWTTTPRSEIYITSKVGGYYNSMGLMGYNDTINDSYIDLILIHWPSSNASQSYSAIDPYYNSTPTNKQYSAILCIHSTWKALELIYNEFVSNFEEKHLMDIINSCWSFKGFYIYILLILFYFILFCNNLNDKYTK